MKSCEFWKVKPGMKRREMEGFTFQNLASGGHLACNQLTLRGGLTFSWRCSGTSPALVYSSASRFVKLESSSHVLELHIHSMFSVYSVVLKNHE